MPRTHRSRSCGDARPLPPDSPDHGAMHGARPFRQDRTMQREREHTPTSPRPSPPPGAERESVPVPLVFPLRLWGRGTGGGGLVVCATLSRSRSRSRIRVTQRQIFQTAAGRIASVCHQDRGLLFRCLYQGIPLIPLYPTLSRQIPPKNCAGRGRNERCADRNSEGRSD